MLGSKTCEIISILYKLCGAGQCCEEVTIRISILMFLLAERGNRLLKCWSTLIGCKCGIAPKVLIL